MERIGGDVERQLGRFDGSGSMPRIVAAWPAAVGDEVARNAWPARIARDGTLHVHAASSVWAFELGQLAPQILERLRDELGPHAPSALRFAQGHLPEPALEAGAAGTRTPVEPTPEAAAEAAAITAPIGDEELRETVRKAVALGLSAGSSPDADGRPV